MMIDNNTVNTKTSNTQVSDKLTATRVSYTCETHAHAETNIDMCVATSWVYVCMNLSITIIAHYHIKYIVNNT